MGGGDVITEAGEKVVTEAAEQVITEGETGVSVIIYALDYLNQVRLTWVY